MTGGDARIDERNTNARGDGAMKVTVLGGRGGWPARDQACGGYLLEHDDCRVLLDPGYATLPLLQRHAEAGEIDAVIISHEHPDHCADLNPLLRARAYGTHDCEPLPVFVPAGAADAVLGLDRFPRVTQAAELIDVADGDQCSFGPFVLGFAELPHHVTNLGVRLTAAAGSVVHTGDSGPHPAVVDLAQGCDLLLIEATFLDAITDDDQSYLCDVGTALSQAEEARVRRAALTHLWPAIPWEHVEARLDPSRAIDASVAAPGATFHIGDSPNRPTG